MMADIKPSPFIYLTDSFDVLTSDWRTFFFFWFHSLTVHSFSPSSSKRGQKKKEHPKDHISNHQAVFIHVSLLDTCQQPSEKC